MIYRLRFMLLLLMIVSLRNDPVYGFQDKTQGLSKFNDSNRMYIAQVTKETTTGNKASTKTPTYQEIRLNSLEGELFINPKFVGIIKSVEYVMGNEVASAKSDIDIKFTDDSWSKLVVPKPNFSLTGLKLTGQDGSLNILLVEEEIVVNNDELKALIKPKIAFGQLNATFITPNLKISKPGDFEIGIFDFKENKFINGDIIALKNNQLPVLFKNLPPAVINGDGRIRVSLREPDGSFINSELSAWGYNIAVEDTELGESVPIKADVFGLPKDAKLRFTFDAIEGQSFSVPVGVYSVEEINSGKPLTMITTSIPGSQPINVTVEESF